MESTQQKHFLIVTYPVQGHINPAIQLAKHLAMTVDGAHITFSTAISGHRKMFPSLASPDQEVQDGAITYVPFSDGYDNGFNKVIIDDQNEFISKVITTCSNSLSAIIDNVNNIDCIIYTFMVSWVADVAMAYRIRSAQYWIQPATVFSIYYHAFHQYNDHIATQCKDPSSTIKLPGLPPLTARDLPSFFLSTSEDDPYSIIFIICKDAFKKLDKEKSKPMVLVNTFDELEQGAFSSVADSIELFAIGPILQSSLSLFKPDKQAYMEWLDSKPQRSVVYVSFGSLTVIKKTQLQELSEGLKASSRPYLWVVRRDNRYEGDELDEDNDEGMIVEWCSQMQVLSHPAVGCFVTHCGWNSTLESLVCGVPTVGVPQWTDQCTNAMLMEKVWGTGVRGEINEDGVLECEGLKRSLDLVLDEGERGGEIRRRVQLWKEKAIQATGVGGSSIGNLQTFISEIMKSDE